MGPNDLFLGKCQGNSENLLLALLFQDEGPHLKSFLFLNGLL